MNYALFARSRQKMLALLCLVAVLLANPGLAFGAADTVIMEETFGTTSNGAIPSGWTQTESGRFGAYDAGDAPGVLFADYNNVPYAHNVSADIVSPALNLQGATEAVLTFSARCDTEYSAPSSGDYMALKFSNGGAMTEITRWNEQSLDADTSDSGAASKEMSFAIPAAYLTSTFKIAFSWNTNASGNATDGCAVDNIKVMADGGTPLSGNTGGDTGGSTDTTAPSITLTPANGTSIVETSSTVSFAASINESVTSCAATLNGDATPLTNDGSGTRFTGGSVLAPGSYTLAVSCTDTAGNTGNSSSTFTVTAETAGDTGGNTGQTSGTIFFENFETVSVSPPGIPAGWTKSGSALWGGYDIGETFGRVIYGDIVNYDPYGSNVNSVITAPPIDASGRTAATATLQTQCDTAYTPPSSGDYMALFSSANGTSFTELVRWNEYSLTNGAGSGEYARGTISANIPAEHLTNTLTLRLAWVTDGTGESKDGCSINDLRVTAEGGDPTPDTTDPVVTISSPQNGSTSGPDVVITATVNEAANQCALSIDGSPRGTLTSNSAKTEFTGTATLETGSHTLTIACTDAAGNQGSATSTFTVETSGETPIAVTSCMTLNEPNRTYILQNDLGSTGNCLTISASNITLDGNGKTLNGGTNNNGSHGIHIGSVSGVTVRNLRVTNFDAGIFAATTTGTVIDTVMLDHNTYGALWRNGTDLELKNISANDNADTGIYLDTVSDSTITNSDTDRNEVGLFLLKNEGTTVRSVSSSENDRGILLIESTGNTLEDISTANNEFGLAFEIASAQNMVEGFDSMNDGTALSIGSPGNNISNVLIDGASTRAIRLFDETAENTTLQGITISDSKEGATDLVMEATDMDGTSLSNVTAGSYTITTPSTFTVSNSHGSVAFLQPTSGSGADLMSAITIAPFTITLDGFAGHARLVMHNVLSGQTGYALTLNGSPCTLCSVEGSLGAATTQFTAASEGTYALTWDGKNATDTTAPTITIESPTNTTYAPNALIPLSVLISEPGSCSFKIDSDTFLNAMTASASSTRFAAGAGFSTTGPHSIAFRCQDISGNTAESPVSFTITNPDGSPAPSLGNIRLESIVSGETVATTTTGLGYLVHFDAVSVPLFDISLLRPNGTVVMSLATSTPANGGKYNWVPSYDLQSGTYMIEVRSTADASLRATTTPFGIIQHPSIVTLSDMPINPNAFPNGFFPIDFPTATTTMTVIQFLGTLQTPYILSSNPNVFMYLPTDASNLPLRLLTFETATSTGTGVLLGNLFLSATTSSGIVGVFFQGDTTITAEFSGAWDGTLHTPQTSSTAGIDTRLSDTLTAHIEKVISIGSDSVNFFFDKAVRLFIKGGARNLVGYVDDGKIVPITNVCAADSIAAGNALPGKSDCRLSLGDDVVVWTKHLTTFVVYSTATSSQETGNNGSGNTGGGGGGSGGGGGASNGPIFSLFSPGTTVLNGTIVGDFTRDGVIDGRDIDAWIALIGTSREIEADLTGDSLVDLRDLNRLMTLFQ